MSTTEFLEETVETGTLPQVVEQPDSAAPPSRVAWPRRAARAVAAAFTWMLGVASLVLGLAILSVVPVLNFLSLGYLVHASGRVAETGRLRDGFVGVRKALVLGRFVLGTWLVFLPVRIVSGLWRDAELIAPGGPTSRSWRVALLILTLVTLLHVVWACLRGGRLVHFIWPAPKRFIKWLSSPSGLSDMRAQVVGYVASLRLPYYFWLGARAFAGAFLWVVIPVGIMIFGAQLSPEKGGGLFPVIGGFLLMLVVMHLPFLQTHFAQQNRFRALFEVRAVRNMFQRAPVAFWLSLLITLLFALPLHLLKIELPPREIAWLPSLFFVMFIFPARLLTGWAVNRAKRRRLPRHWLFRWGGRFALLPVALFYVLVVYLSQYLSWYGSLSLLEQHAFMVPAPLMSL